MRAFLAAAALLLSGILVWLLARTPAAPLSAPSILTITEGAAESAAAALGRSTLSAAPEVLRTSLPSEEENQQTMLASLPHTSLRVRVGDPYSVLDGSCSIDIEVTMPDGRGAHGKRYLEGNGECRFDLVPAGECELKLMDNDVTGRERMEICSESFSLTAGVPMARDLDLGQQLAMVELQWTKPPRGGAHAVQLRRGSQVVAGWNRKDSQAELDPGVLKACVPVGYELKAVFMIGSDEHFMIRAFPEPGRHVWKVAPPAGELHVSWPPSGGADKFFLEPSIMGETRARRSCASTAGKGAFGLLEPGRYLLSAGTTTEEGFEVRAQRMVEIGTEPVEVTLSSASVGSLQFAPIAAPSPDRPGGYPGRAYPASLHAVGCWLPVYVLNQDPEAGGSRFEGVLAGEYDLVLRHGHWWSRTTVTVAAGAEAMVFPRAWTQPCALTVNLTGRDRFGIAHVRLRTDDGLDMELAWLRPSHGGDEWTTVLLANPGPARLSVSCLDGVQTEYEFVVADHPGFGQTFQLPD